jgi:cytochrome bd ubiquinol oxidase subunit II
VIFKTDGVLQRKAVRWAQGGIWGVVIGMGAVSAATPLVSARIFDKWFRFPEIVTLAPLPLMAGALVALLWIALKRLPDAGGSFRVVPFAGATALMVLGFSGMAYSFYPYIVPEKADDPRGRRRDGKPVDHPCGGDGRAAGDPVLHGAGLYDLSRQGDGAAL